MEILWIRQKAQGVFQLTDHAEEERIDEDISIDDIQSGAVEAGNLGRLCQSERIRGETCLVLGHAINGNPIHLVVARLSTDSLRVVTVYIPRPPKWVDARTRRPT